MNKRIILYKGILLSHTTASVVCLIADVMDLAIWLLVAAAIALQLLSMEQS